jgi:hypothetical protein
MAAFLPLILLGATGVTAFARRVVARTADPMVGNLSQSGAGWIADRACARLIGGEVDVVDTAPQSAYALHRHTPVYGWNVRCRTEQGDYLIRINARTFRVFGVNRVSLMPESPPRAAARVSMPASEADIRRLSRREAEAHARRYLRMVGLPTQEMNSLSPSHVVYSSLEEHWTFTYRNQVPDLGQRTLSVTVSGYDGRLENLWNPAGCLGT